MTEHKLLLELVGINTPTAKPVSGGGCAAAPKPKAKELAEK